MTDVFLLEHDGVAVQNFLTREAAWRAVRPVSHPVTDVWWGPITPDLWHLALCRAGFGRSGTTVRVRRCRLT